LGKYKCIKGFNLPICDDDGFETDNYEIIEEGTIWHTPEDENYRLIGGEVRLESDDLGWLEMSKETLKQCFKPIN
jgi:hypothetical protein